MSEFKHPADYFKSDKYRQLQKQRAASSFESDTVTFMLRLLKLQKRERDLRRACSDRTGSSNLTLADFHNEFPTFPIYLGARSLKDKKLHENDKMRLPTLYKTFWEAPFIKPYLEFRQTVLRRAGDRAVGLVFFRRGVPGGLVVHDGRDLPDRVLGGLALVYRPVHQEEILYEDFQGKAIYVQPLSSVVGALFNKGHGWRP